MNIWPDAGRPDLVVSIGTGYARPKTSKDCNLPSKRTFHNGFIGRGLRAFLFSPAADGKKGFEDALDDLSKDIKEDIFRLDKDLGEELPELDNVEHIDQLSQIACEIPSDLARALLTTSFFFELDEEPSFTDGQYRCNGSILCSRSFPEGILALVEKELPSARFTMHNRVGLGLVQKHDGCKICGYYRKQISFYLSSLYEDFRLEITSRTGSRKIGGFPTSLTVLLKRQQAYAVFGRSDHKTDQWPPSRKCYCSINDKPINNKRLNEDPVCGADVLKRKKVKFAI
ncbi:hypothetical protein N7474_010099 [Penicillium riverlandense]|uniref:uncharacterized protein n=1 Tax=Penicillium riverlandense TaxID=1903569 RepID=UPI0025488D13|nr:uncharacterized protein N7474_010099 [Penicillium riverlandense]KAJ5808830.1 hypothetical protein N7474_010099 [Penicillium riverlandense]